MASGVLNQENQTLLNHNWNSVSTDCADLHIFTSDWSTLQNLKMKKSKLTLFAQRSQQGRPPRIWPHLDRTGKGKHVPVSADTYTLSHTIVYFIWHLISCTFFVIWSLSKKVKNFQCPSGAWEGKYYMRNVKSMQLLYMRCVFACWLLDFPTAVWNSESGIIRGWSRTSSHSMSPHPSHHSYYSHSAELPKLHSRHPVNKPCKASLKPLPVFLKAEI